MKTYVQLGEAAFPASERVEYRNGFRDFISGFSDLQLDRVILVEPNERLIPQIELLWQSWSRVEFRAANISLDSGLDKRQFYSSETDTRFREVFSPDEPYVRRYFPSGDLIQTAVEQFPLAAFISEVAGADPIEILSMDLRRQNVSRFALINWAELPVKELILTTDGLSRSDLTVVRKALKRSGFVGAGRSWGEARTIETFRKSDTVLTRVNSAVKQLKVDAGEVAETFARLIPNDEQRAAFIDRMTVVLHPAYSRRDVLDSGFGRQLKPVKLNRVEEFIAFVEHSEESEWSVHADAEPSIDEVANKCFQEHSVWPISFSYPKLPIQMNSQPMELLCSITPGFPYSFEDESEYLQTYANAHLGLTHRKAGWDCFRHIEILASGAVPLMIDADQIPEYSMVHYPKGAFREVVNEIENQAGLPSSDTRESFHKYFETNLSSKAMATYMLRVSGFQDASRVLFIDEQLPVHGDYQSVLALIGLKQIYGDQCEVAFPVDYIYQETSVDTAQLYGRGFGYTRVLPSNLKTENEILSNSFLSLGSIDWELFDCVVIGSVSRNCELAGAILKVFPAARTIWIHGEDSPPTIRESKKLRDSGANVFVRSIS